MARLPNPGGDDNQWGDILNDFLKVEHNADGSQKPLPQSKIASLTTDLAGKVDTSRTINGHALTSDVTVTRSDVGLANADNTSDASKPTSIATQSALDGKQSIAEKGQASGYAGLGANGLVPIAQLAAGVPDGTKFIRDDGTLQSSESRLGIPTAWSGATSYKVGDVAIRANALFVCKAAHANQDPFTDCATVLEGTYWTFLALRGAVQNYVAAAEQITATSLSLAPTPDAVTLYCPTGLILFNFVGQWKLTGAGIAASSAAMHVDNAAIPGVGNNGSAVTGTGTLPAAGLFWGPLAPYYNAHSNVGMIVTGTSNTADSPAPTLPLTGYNNAGYPPLAIHVAPGVHTLALKLAAGNGTTIVNVRERRLVAVGQ